MNILFYRYNSICEHAIISAWKQAGHRVIEITVEMQQKSNPSKQQLQSVSTALQQNSFDFVFTINFFPIISEVCNIFKVPYACWIVDSPVLELYSYSLQNPCNRIFLFDYALYEEFSVKNPDCVFYLPLAADITTFAPICDSITTADQKKYACDISFVGSLYTEKCPYNKLQNVPKYLQGYLNGIIDAQLKVYGYNFIRDLITEDIALEFEKHFPNFYQFPEKSEKNNIALVSDLYISTKVTEQERIRLFNALSEKFCVDLYTGSDTTPIPHIINKGLANTYSDMPKIFHLSKINLNLTAKSIKTALPLRIWDILACGGFLITNYQTEIPEYFEIGKDLEIYASQEELIDKCNYYLKHDTERKKIALTGHEKVKSHHTLEKRLDEMITLIFS